MLTILPAALRNARKAAGLSQAALARAAGLSDGYIAMLELGQRTNPSLRTVRSLATALQTDVSAFAVDRDG